ncbi:FAD-dependent monooxygenase [Massilia sp. TN1-12]|uniref:FAD-dependent monooxygenase n=1 Tax=Massilia paldalensis TaxID=3377675 RepID=UPI00384C6A49
MTPSIHPAHDVDAIVVGGGLAGLAMSRTLHRQGVHHVVLERRDTVSNEGFGINLPGNAIAALHALGVGDALSTLGTPTRRREYRDHRDRLLFEVDEDAFWGPSCRPRCVKRSELMALLRDGLPEDTLHLSSPVESIVAGGGAATVATPDGRVFNGRLVVGADGVHSRTRACTFPDTAVRSAVLSTSSWRFIAPDPGVDCWKVWAGPQALFLLIPLGNGEVYGWASDTSADTTRDLADVFAGFPAAVTTTVDFLMAHPDHIHHSPLAEVRMPAWSRERVVLIGDAAHATAPVWAQGGALAFEDAQALGAILAGGGDWSDAGARFEAARRARVDHVQAMTDKMSKAARLPAFLRNLLLPFVGPKNYAATYGPLRTAG